MLSRNFRFALVFAATFLSLFSHPSAAQDFKKQVIYQIVTDRFFDGDTWENGSNHQYTVPTSGVGTVNVNWQY